MHDLGFGIPFMPSIVIGWWNVLYNICNDHIDHKQLFHYYDPRTQFGFYKTLGLLSIRELAKRG